VCRICSVVAEGSVLQPSSGEDQADRIKEVCKYFNVWEPPPNSSLRAVFVMNTLVPKIEYSDVRLALEVRGKPVQV
jgi:hypothetical protein